MKFSKILVVFDPTRKDQPALERAMIVAREREIGVHIFSCIYTENQECDIDIQISKQKDKLDSLSKTYQGKVIPVTTEVVWGEDWYQAVVLASQQSDIGIVFKSTYKHLSHKRILNKTSDWTLIRKCQCPVLLVRGDTESRDIQKILAAVDLRDGKDEYIEGNKNIINISRQVLEDKNTEVHFITAYKDSLDFPDRSRLMRVCGAANDRIHVKQGAAEQVIVENAKLLDISLVVLGSSGRSGLSALVRGNTAEKILDDLECDVLSIPQ